MNKSAKYTSAFLMVAWMAGSALAQLAPVHFGVAGRTPILDEFGNVLRGTSPGDPGHQQGVIVQILGADGNIIHPPSTNGVPHPDNPVVATVRVGYGTSPTLGPTPGIFSGTLSHYRTDNHPKKVFARVFNHVDTEYASFYTDSSILQAPHGSYSVLEFDLTATTTELDTTDWDGDGLSRSWELSLGTDPGNPDTDGDGILDGDEFLAGTDPLDPDDFLQMVQLIPAGGADVYIVWATAPGRTYQVEYTTDSLVGSPEFLPVGDPLTAQEDEFELSIFFPNGLALDNAHYRVRLIVD
ncbi:MAG TPA: hypothetical protein PKE55_07280 [Kiritimatiellia bacterium]|nr:hypothetical protein [Kiritimatiellia bacterium]